MPKLKSPIYTFGGKGCMTAKLLALLPPHTLYVEPFGGGGSLLFAKPPSPSETWNDVDGGLVNFFRVLRDPALFPAFYDRAAYTPYARAEYNRCRATWDEAADPVERAYRFFVVAKMSFAGHFGGSFRTTVATVKRGMPGSVSSWLFTLEHLPELHARLMRVQIEGQDWETILARYDTPETVFYCDPPYVPETRRSGGYAHELTLTDHARLVERLLAISGMALLSGYDHPVYAPLLTAGWERVDFPTACYATGRTKPSGVQGVGSALSAHARVESVWRSPRALAACASVAE